MYSFYILPPMICKFFFCNNKQEAQKIILRLLKVSYRTVITFGNGNENNIRIIHIRYKRVDTVIIQRLYN